MASFSFLAAHGILPTLCLVGASAGCSRDQRPHVYEFTVRVWSDPGRPLADAAVMRGASRLGTTGVKGSVRFGLTGPEGFTVPLAIRCPAGFMQPSEPLSVVLKRVAKASHAPEYEAYCAPELRKIVVAIRAEKGPNLPIFYLGKALARTDESGIAHVLVEQAPDSQFELTLGTNEPNARALRPQNPTTRFFVHDHDDVVPLIQKFVTDTPDAAKPLTHRRPPEPESTGPIRLQVPHK